MRFLFLQRLLILLCAINFQNINAQKKVVIMGSSTARGTGASSYELSWAGKLENSFNQNMSDGVDTLFYNIALTGSTTYSEMPSGFTPPPSRPSPSPAINVTKALSYNPDVVIINLPSNDVAEGYSITETMNNFRLMYTTITASGAACYVTTAQPRNDLNATQRQLLLDTRDSILQQFGFFSINFWDDLVTPDGLNLLRDDRRDTSGLIHPNDIGHDFLFLRVKEKNIFSNVPLKISFTYVAATSVNGHSNITWHAEEQEPHTFFEVERSADGISFLKIKSLQALSNQTSSDYTVIDDPQLAGISFYRIKAISPSGVSYSNIISISNKKSTLSINKLYKDDAANNLTAELSLLKNDVVSVSLINMAGAIVHQRKQYVTGPSDRVVIPIANLSQGQYYIRISTGDNNNFSIKPFVK